MYAQLLIAASFAVAAYGDVKERAVSDLVWVPALVGAGYAIYFVYANLPGPDLEYLLLKIAVVGGIALVFTVLGAIGQADAIAMALIASDPYLLSPLAPLFASAAVALAHIGYEYLVGNTGSDLVIPLKRFLREQCWIPKAIVSGDVRTEVASDVNVAREDVEARAQAGAMIEVRYGVPTVAYLGIGYVAYLAYLVLFNYGAFASLP